ncbi:nitrite/sulfite reductase [bacterium]|nr:nitrite/sulfite reductase [bacterium]
MPAKPELTAVERDKLEIDPDFDFREIAKKQYDDIPPNVMAMFKWCGVYTQLQKGFFMIRLVTPGGLITTKQFSRAVDLAEEFAQGELCITTRQTLQFHWVRQQDIYKVLEGMADVGMTTKNGCGDVTRNTISCSLQGVCPYEIDNARSLIMEIATDPEIRDQQRNLPRKHKISVAGCERSCAQTLMNCQGWTPVTRKSRKGEDEIGWKFHAGGGLGARPYLGKVVFDWVPRDLALYVARATIEAFRRHGDRRNRALARLKIVVDGMGPRAFGLLLLDIMRERGLDDLQRIEIAKNHTPTIQPAFLDGQAVIAQRQKGFNTVRVRIPRSEIRTVRGRTICRLADQYGVGEIMLTSRQNVEIRHVPDEKVDTLLAELREAVLQTEGHERIPDVVSCVGSTQCKLAVTDTPKSCFGIMEELGADEEFWKEVGSLRINITGCPNNCAHAWLGDIGLRGRRRRMEEGRNVEGYSVFLGGRLDGAGHIGELVCEVDAAALVPALRRILSLYLKERTGRDETFAAYVRRATVDFIGEKVVAG